jgi:hypothetical protein
LLRCVDPADSREQRECLGRVDVVIVAQRSPHRLHSPLQLGFGFA